MDSEELKRRTKEFALQVIKLVEFLPRTRTGNIIGAQLLRAATSVGANYRAACRARSQAEFISKIGVVEEEADESLYWLELILASGLEIGNCRLKIDDLMREANELTSIFAASHKSAKLSMLNRKSKRQQSSTGLPVGECVLPFTPANCFIPCVGNKTARGY